MPLLLQTVASRNWTLLSTISCIHPSKVTFRIGVHPRSSRIADEYDKNCARRCVHVALHSRTALHKYLHYLVSDRKLTASIVWMSLYKAGIHRSFISAFNFFPCSVCPVHGFNDGDFRHKCHSHVNQPQRTRSRRWDSEAFHMDNLPISLSLCYIGLLWRPCFHAKQSICCKTFPLRVKSQYSWGKRERTCRKVSHKVSITSRFRRILYLIQSPSNALLVVVLLATVVVY